MEDLKSFDPEISDEVFFLFSDLIHKTSGIKLPPVKKGLLISRLLKRLKLLEIHGFSEYYQRVKQDNEELVEMLNCISTNTTMFFREHYHFEFLKNPVIPSLIGRKKEKTIRIWSAGCSTGEEPYSIAMAVHEAMRRYACQGEKGTGGDGRRLSAETQTGRTWPVSEGQWDLQILATDISTKVLSHAETAIYEYEQLPDDIPEDVIRRYFLKGVRANRGKIQAKDFIRETVQFRRLNLKDAAFPFNKKFDAIFCRNVMIYFDEDMKRHVLSAFHQHLSEGGYLFLGHSETMIGRETFRPVHITVYQKI